MVSKDQVQAVRGGNAVDNSGDKIGSIGEVYLDDKTGQPAWITVNTGLFGTSESFVPLQEATVEGEDVRVPYSKDQVKDAPRVDAGQHLDVEHEQELYRHYGLQYGDGDNTQGRTADADGRGQAGNAAAGTAAAGTAGVAGTAGRGDRADADYAKTDGRDADAVAGRTDGRDADYANTGAGDRAAAAGTTANAGDSVVRHEEHLNVGTETREAGTVRLRKYVTTETETVEVPVRREEVHVERVPVEGEGRVVDGDPFEESTQEVKLHEEVPVVNKETRAVEEVKLGTETVEGTETVSGQVRQEHIDVDRDGDVDGKPRR